jgi:hypothetical protein
MHGSEFLEGHKMYSGAKTLDMLGSEHVSSVASSMDLPSCQRIPSHSALPDK